MSKNKKEFSGKKQSENTKLIKNEKERGSNKNNKNIKNKQANVDNQKSQDKAKSVEAVSGFKILLKIVIGVLSVMIVLLLSGIFYQIGKNGVSKVGGTDTEQGKELSGSIEKLSGDKDENNINKVNDSKASELTKSPNNFENDVKTQDGSTDDSSGNVSKNDVKKLKEELDGISNEYDDLQGVDELLEGWMP